MARIRVLVVDDHRIFAESLAAALAAEQDVDVAAAGSGPAALRCLERAAAEGRRFDVLLVDADLGTAADGMGPPLPVPAELPYGGANGTAHSGIHGGARVGAHGGPNGGPHGGAHGGPGAGAHGGPGVNGSPARAVNGRAADGISLVGAVRSAQPGVRTVVLAERDDPRRAAAALQAGASGWVAKDCSLVRLLAVIRGVLREETHLPPALLTGVLRELTAARKHRTESERLVESLTPREREVLRCMVAGLGRKAVAERLFLSPHTVRTHMQNVLGKLGVHSTLAAVALARRAGVGPVDLAGEIVERGGQLA
ncbi:LuxR C-terminal-related transcriptional regulator [Streptomyces rugosispiralis]|uniref:Response regulator transcription factor n=1 Tax=Streptomyces rugosispiralis TaxID=2967341 RepID=A0ABT1V573_9ACTN|nr:response regulator transcription factor [Streptomyces rugosispiralis]MCQ8191895.1 response regulator transcription factor [Streptomyces rugosispiralis]